MHPTGFFIPAKRAKRYIPPKKGFQAVYFTHYKTPFKRLFLVAQLRDNG